MRAEHPVQGDIPALKQLWQQAFGDGQPFLEAFFTAGFSPRRCRCIRAGAEMAAALYWFDCTLGGEKWAYFYGVATEQSRRGRGLGRFLMEDAQRLLADRGYAGAVLVPGEQGLFAFYEKLGYRRFGGMDVLEARRGEPVSLKKLTPRQYAALRPRFLPEGALEQAGMEFFGLLADFYAGPDCLAAVARQEPFFAPELLGDPAAAPGILAALGKEQGCFRVPGAKAFAMYLAFGPAEPPEYLGIAFD